MDIKKYASGAFLLLLAICSYAQVTIRPFLGVSSGWCRGIDLKGNIGNYNFLTGQNYGIEIDKKFNRSAFGFSAKNTQILLGAEVYKEGWSWPTYRVNKFGVGMLNLGFFHTYDLLAVSRRNKSTVQATKPILMIKSIVGINFLKSERNIDWYGGVVVIGGGDSSAFVLEKDDFDVSKFVDKAFYGYSFDLGLSFNFYTKRKEVFGLRILANIGLKDMLRTEYEFRERYADGSMYEASGTFASRGSNFAVDMSIPITIIKANGERRKDRKL